MERIRSHYVLMNSEANGKRSIKIVKVTHASSLEVVVDNGHRKKRYVGATRDVRNVQRDQKGPMKLSPWIA